MIGRLVEKPEDLVVKGPEDFKSKQNINVHVNHEVLEIDGKQQRVYVEGKSDGQGWWEPYDELMIATGALPVRIQVDGADAAGIFGISTLDSGLEICHFLEESNPERAVVIGGGYIGLEMAENLIQRGLAVDLVELNKEVMSTLDTDMGKLVSDALMGIGVNLYREERFDGFKTKNGKVSAVVTDKRTLPADIVVMGIGVKPNTRLAEKGGIPLGPTQGIKVNALMQTETEHVWAGGDCAESFHVVARQPIHIALGTVANKHGRVAGLNIGGEYDTFPGVVGTAVSKICDIEVARTGLQEKEAQSLGMKYVTKVIHAKTRAGYYPEAGTISVKLIAEKVTGRFLGGQIVGKEGAAKRIDILATALHAGMTLREIINLDLSYAPPFSPVWDPVATAARVLVKDV